jgi:hypothetical protein
MSNKVELEQILLERLLEDVFGQKSCLGDHCPDQGSFEDDSVWDLVLDQEFEFDAKLLKRSFPKH